MKFKINDAVAVLDDNLTGVITNIEASEITVSISTGLDLVFDSSELVKMKQNVMTSHTLFSNTSIENVLKEKKSNKKQIPSKSSKVFLPRTPIRNWLPTTGTLEEDLVHKKFSEKVKAHC